MIQNVQEEKVIKLMCEVLELGESSEKIVVAAVKKAGVSNFFETIDALDIEVEEKDRIRSLKEVVEMKAKSIEGLEGGR